MEPTAAERRDEELEQAYNNSRLYKLLSRQHPESWLDREGPNWDKFWKLIAEGTSVINYESPDYGYETTLMAAVASGTPEHVRALLDRGADLNKRNIFGKAAIMYAMQEERLEKLEVLLQGGADVEQADNLGSTPVITAVSKRAPRVLARILEAGAQVDARNRDGMTALQLAAATNRLSCAEVLLQAGASTRAQVTDASDITSDPTWRMEMARRVSRMLPSPEGALYTDYQLLSPQELALVRKAFGCEVLLRNWATREAAFGMFWLLRHGRCTTRSQVEMKQLSKSLEEHHASSLAVALPKLWLAPSAGDQLVPPGEAQRRSDQADSSEEEALPSVRALQPATTSSTGKYVPPCKAGKYVPPCKRNAPQVDVESKLRTTGMHWEELVAMAEAIRFLAEQADEKVTHLVLSNIMVEH
ncbi:hypothetical protein CYMTET_23837 [Cymbomonas tetramitiformis]|uniref:Uncharacterized protein n=1 Tax=Cymbomonas tetramitiformis TaxID=36881 RepID=A0AAE0L0T7_9CHLO|nr:hypothetical protein CYMTET_23837 [Cymbomonas tetramitiformis]